jgi:hypothetical protein
MVPLSQYKGSLPRLGTANSECIHTSVSEASKVMEVAVSHWIAWENSEIASLPDQAFDRELAHVPRLLRLPKRRGCTVDTEYGPKCATTLVRTPGGKAGLVFMAPSTTIAGIALFVFSREPHKVPSCTRHVKITGSTICGQPRAYLCRVRSPKSWTRTVLCY